jgi:hypothetical protein
MRDQLDIQRLTKTPDGAVVVADPLAAQLAHQRCAGEAVGKHTAADSILRFEHGHGPAPARKIMRCSEAGESRADDDAGL